MQVLIFGGRTWAVLTSGGGGGGGGHDTRAEWKILQGRSLLNQVLSVHNMLLCMFQWLCTYFQDTGVHTFGGGGGGYVLLGYCSRQQISVKNEGVLYRRKFSSAKKIRQKRSSGSSSGIYFRQTSVVARLLAGRSFAYRLSSHSYFWSHTCGFVEKFSQEFNLVKKLLWRKRRN